MLEQVRVVLVETSHPGNLGAAARAMKTMGLSDLVLVSPSCEINAEAIARASGAGELLTRATIVPTLAEALHDTTLVFGSSARARGMSGRLHMPREMAQEMLQTLSAANATSVVSSADTDAAPAEKVALVFGPERTGLNNDDLALCHSQVMVPCNPDYSSLNLGAAVQIFCYELRSSWLASQNFQLEQQVEDRPATGEQVEMFYAHLQQTLEQIEFLDPGNPRKLMDRMRRFYQRARLEQMELNIFRGILTAVNKKLKG
ncbi:RNA methyltransferase [Pelagibaculum spongiae]|uniref:tRNA (cytidine/uridine-2'-O-)-methyltransferase TrmJ n=1 Tax=Pelagibaculum spongiae TaxID=2080658 RepID=A0A2V1H1G3_9GAMM|nr:RNA methyltransferase [Pelagibaculum spongiae]PVZ72353.1 tRNA (cytosine(32)/uridine(32)-2'-O)-methyltransferase TrmJ [Pelagibaculum spongiae]